MNEKTSREGEPDITFGFAFMVYSFYSLQIEEHRKNSLWLLALNKNVLLITYPFKISLCFLDER